MERLIGWTKADAWGSTNAIPEFLGAAAGDDPVSEVWFGAHPDGPTLLTGGQTLAEYIGEDPKRALGGGLLYAFGPTLPYLAKIIAPAQTLSLQVHPTKEIAREGYLREEVLGIERTDTRRVYRDVPRKARELLVGLEGELADRLRYRLKLSTVRGGLRSLATWLFDEDSPATPERVEEFVAACRSRLASGTSPSPRTDELVSVLGDKHPGDPGIIVAFLMNPVSLRPGEAVYIPPRQIHAYQSGLGIEVMASSDNVVRAGLTGKYVDSAQLVEITEFSALPPVRVAPEHPSATTDRFLAPAQEFELSVTTLAPGKHTSRVDEVAVPGEGPRIVIATSGSVTLHVSEEQGGDSVELSRGQAVFVSAAERRVWAYGTGSFVQVAAP